MWVKEYNEAIEKLGDISAFTDDTSIMEAAGFKVKTVEGSFKNIKITTPEDIAIAKILEGEEE
jgi:2-C-methyl-D-erythritol 4-phosphate cytidylyltransferase